MDDSEAKYSNAGFADVAITGEYTVFANMQRRCVMIRAYKVELHPSAQQAHDMVCTFGVVRYVYNWYINVADAWYKETNTFLTGYDFSKGLTQCDRDEWFLQAPSKAIKASIMNGEKAFKHYFDVCNNPKKHPKSKKRKAKEQRAKEQGKTLKPFGYPRYKCKSDNHDSYYLIGSIHVERHRIRLPKLGWVRLKEYGYIPTDKPVKSVTVSRTAGRFYVSVLIDDNEPVVTQPNPNGDVIGIDVGLKSLAVTSDNHVYQGMNDVNKVRKLERKAARLDRKITRQRKANENRDDSKYEWRNYQKTLLAKRKLNQRLSNMKIDNMRKIVADIIARQPSAIVIEHLNVKGMFANKHLSNSLRRQSIGTFMTMLVNKAIQSGIEVRQVSTWFASSKLCHECGWYYQQLTLRERTWTCKQCGHTHDRDMNAALNLRDADEYVILDSVDN